jgi:hypothetical protein
MALKYIDFVKAKKIYESNIAQLNEAFENNKVEHVLELVERILKNHIDDNLMSMPSFDEVTIGGEKYRVKQYVVFPDKDSKISACMFTLNWKIDNKSSEIYSVSFFDNLDYMFNGEAEATATIITHKVSIVNILPLIWDSVNNRDFSFSDEYVSKTLKTNVQDTQETPKESYYDAYYFKYRLFEGENLDIQNTFEAEDSEAMKQLKAKKEELNNAKSSPNKDQDLIRKLYQEYTELVDAVYKDHATTDEEVKLSIERRKQMKEVPSSSVKSAETEFSKQQGKKDPEQVFKEMAKYIELVIKGIQTSVIICGAPGVGKTYRVRKQLKEAGYKEGENMYTYKGKGTPRALYLTLYNYRKKGDIIVIDDADALVGPKAPEDSINILKAALDSTSDDEGRLVNYGIATKLTDDEGKPIDKKFYYNGGIIVITNYNVGQLDSALRGRAFIQDISFTIEETLGIIKGLMPDIEPDKYSKESKMKAYAFLEELSKDKQYKMNISVRIFCLCAKLFESCAHDDDFNDEDVKSMIKEQMKNQSAEGGKKY